MYPCLGVRMLLRIIAAASLFAVTTMTAQTRSRDLSFLDGINESERLSSSEVAKLEIRVTNDPADLAARTRLLAHYYLHQLAHPRLQHILWVVKNRPDSKLAGSLFVQIAPGSKTRMTRSDYESVRRCWIGNIEQYSGTAAVLSNAASFFEYEEPELAADLLERSLRMDAGNRMRRAALDNFYTRIVSRCESGDNACPSPASLARLQSTLKSLPE